MATSEVRRKYFEAFGQKVPYSMFGNDEEADRLAREAIQEGEPLTQEEWLRARGHSENEINDIQNSELLI
jgi:hypothetical protein